MRRRLFLGCNNLGFNYFTMSWHLLLLYFSRTSVSPLICQNNNKHLLVRSVSWQVVRTEDDEDEGVLHETLTLTSYYLILSPSDD